MIEVVKRKIHVGLVDVSMLKYHELAFMSHVKYLMAKIEKRGIIRKPIIVDKDTMGVIDGVHRATTLRMLKARYIPAFLIDYINDEEIVVDKWFRTYTLKFPLHDEISHIKSILCIEGFEEASNKIKICENGIEGYIQIKNFEKEYRWYIKSIKIKERHANIRKENVLTIEPPLLTKWNVIMAIKKNILLPPRSTRHITFLKRLYLPYNVEDLKGLGSSF
ncbi:MAG: ParB N-terminal domain-containing protein [Caldisphaeraceae archaeon]|nr:ParB N-terminal domain-containing protein [Caldisphaeraceae archaeon]